jgi:hypothetical protein
MKEPAEEKPESEGSGAKDGDGMADLAGEVCADYSNVGRGIAEVGKHGGNYVLHASYESGVGVVEARSYGSELARGFGYGADVEL